MVFGREFDMVESGKESVGERPGNVMDDFALRVCIASIPWADSVLIKYIFN